MLRSATGLLNRATTSKLYGRSYSKISGAMADTRTKPIESSIRSKLQEHFQPSFLEVLNESYMHKVPKGSETHFKVVVVSEKFEGLPLIKRHRSVNEILQEELNGGVHALSIIAKTPQQWDESSKKIDKSPACRGGAGL